MDTILTLLVMPIAISVVVQVYKKIIGYKHRAYIIHLIILVLALIWTFCYNYFKVSGSFGLLVSTQQAVATFAVSIAIYEVILKHLGFSTSQQIKDKKIEAIDQTN